MKKVYLYIGGLLAGTLNGMLGAGGGMIIVPMLTSSGLSQRKAHATSVCIILPICVFSALNYIMNGYTTIQDALPYVFWGIPGSLIGTWILPKINQKLLKKVFGVLMIWASYRMVCK